MSLIFSEGGIGGVTEEELQKAVDELQSQIDTISAASDCTDIVGTYTDLQNYDTSTLTDNDIIKVLNDTTHNGQPSYYRWSTSTDQFTYIGSEERVNDGTLTIKYGAETVGTFSANQSANATVNLPETDLTNYYDKTETDTLLDEKQDKLTPNAPLTISSYIKSNLTNMEISNDGRYVVRGNDATVPNLGKPYFDNASNCRFYCRNGNVPDLSTYTSEEIMASIGYIQMPYTLGQIVNCGYMGSYGRSPVVFGKTVGDSFIPIFYMNFINTVNSTSTGAITTSDTVTPTRYSSSYITFDQTSTNTSFGTVYTSGSTSLYTGGLAQIYDNSTSITLTLIVGRDRGTYSAGIRSTVTDITLLARLREINAARIFPGSEADSLYLTTAIGLYNYNSMLPYDLNVQAIPAEWGENLFDISGQQAYNYLDLHLGAGLSVDGNGNLVNTNPTAPAVMTGATSSTAGTSGLVPAPAAGDDTKFLSGDGTYKVATTDLSNYYNKSQTDALLDDKEDKFTPAEPLSIGKIIYQQDAITVVGQYINYLQEISTTQFIADTSRSSNTVTIPTTQPGNRILDTSKAFYYVGDLKGLIVNTQNNNQNPGYCSFIIGRLEADNTFTPHIVVEPGNLAYYGSIASTSGDTTQGVNRTIYNLGTATTAQNQGTDSYYGSYPQTVVTQLTTSNSMTRILNDYRSGTAYLDHSYSYLTTPIAYEDWDDNCIIFAISTAKQKYLNNKFYITKNNTTIWTPSWSDEQTYLKLGIGAGLAVQNGNLVNTNPTPVDVSTKVTGTGVTDIKALTQAEYEALATPDATTMYVLTDGGAIYLGTILIANNATGGGGIQSTNSVVPTNNRALGSITSTTEVNE